MRSYEPVWKKIERRDEVHDLIVRARSDHSYHINKVPQDKSPLIAERTNANGEAYFTLERWSIY